MKFHPFIKLERNISPKNKFEELNDPLIVPTPTPSPTPTPTPKPLTLAEMNQLYGPCVRLPVLMYHHVQSHEAAVASKQTNLTVDTSAFISQMQYLKDKGYSVVSMNDLINFFDFEVGIPGKSILITFDDGYSDFYSDAYPILSGLGFYATVFVPTGLVNNSGYLSWGQMSGVNSLILFANHTWSHKNVASKNTPMESEISTADLQLSEHGLNSPKVFAYPYGPSSTLAQNYLSSLGYKLAFTTQVGNILCKQKRFELPRVRIGNGSLSNYGF